MLLAGQHPRGHSLKHHYIFPLTTHNSLHRGEHTRLPFHLLALPAKLHTYIYTAILAKKDIVDLPLETRERLQRSN